MKFICAQFTECPVSIELWFFCLWYLLTSDECGYCLFVIMNKIEMVPSHRIAKEQSSDEAANFAWPLTVSGHSMKLHCASTRNSTGNRNVFSVGQSSFILLLFSFIYSCIARLKTNHYNSHGNCEMEKGRTKAIWAAQDASLAWCVCAFNGQVFMWMHIVYYTAPQKSKKHLYYSFSKNIFNNSFFS